MALKEGFEPSEGNIPLDSLANCWFKPLTHFNINKQEQSQESVSTKENFEGFFEKERKETVLGDKPHILSLAFI